MNDADRDIRIARLEGEIRRLEQASVEWRALHAKEAERAHKAEVKLATLRRQVNVHRRTQRQRQANRDQHPRD